MFKSKSFDLFENVSAHHNLSSSGISTVWWTGGYQIMRPSSNCWRPRACWISGKQCLQTPNDLYWKTRTLSTLWTGLIDDSHLNLLMQSLLQSSVARADMALFAGQFFEPSWTLRQLLANHCTLISLIFCSLGAIYLCGEAINFFNSSKLVAKDYKCLSSLVSNSISNPLDLSLPINMGIRVYTGCTCGP